LGILLLIITGILIAPASGLSTVFSDHFGGTEVDTAKWSVQENTNMIGNPAYGGSVQVAHSNIILSSIGSSFPCVTTAVNPFPTSSDFALVFNFTYKEISDWGNGLWISNGAFIDNGTSLFVASNVIFQLWAGNINYNEAAIYVNLLNKQVYKTIIHGWEPSANTQTFSLQLCGTIYTLFVDGVEVSSIESQLRPDTIGFGHPQAYYLPFTSNNVRSVIGGWSSFEIDYIQVLPLTNLSVNTSVSSTELGFGVDINGTLTTKEGQPLQGKNIILSYQIPGVSAWNYFTSVTTDAKGTYSAAWLPTATGCFVIKAEWKGDDTQLGASDAKNISVIRSADNSLFFVESNSTLSSLSFNTSANEISFAVSGQAGTTGYVKFLISKTLLANLAQFAVYLDGKEIKFNATSTNSLYALYFEYSHSTHEVKIQLPGFTSSPSPSFIKSPTPVTSLSPEISLEPTPTRHSIQAEDFTQTIIILVLAAVAVIIGVLAYLAKHKRMEVNPQTKRSLFFAFFLGVLLREQTVSEQLSN